MRNILIQTIFLLPTVSAELVSGEYYAITDERDPNVERFIQFSMSLRGKPAILGEFSFIFGFDSQLKLLDYPFSISRSSPLHHHERKH